MMHNSAAFPVQAQLSAVLDVMSREAIRQISRVFRELYLHVVAENQALKEKVGNLEAELRSKVDVEVDLSRKRATQTILKIKPTGQYNDDNAIMSWRELDSLIGMNA